MNSTPDITELLDTITQPAFYVSNGQISECNTAAQRLSIELGTAINEFFPYKTAQYDTFQSGYLFLAVRIHGKQIGASATRLNDGTLFILDGEEQITELKALSLTAENMRQPLSSMIATANNLFPLLENSENPKIPDHMERINKNLHQMHRMLCNMSDALQYADGSSKHLACYDIVSLIKGIFQKAQSLADHCDIQLNYIAPDKDILCIADGQLLERGVLNIISNAIKFSEPGSTIDASLTCQDNTIYIRICDHGSGIPSQLTGTIFHHYRRTPGLEDRRFGLGLGLALVRSAATVHQGAVLIDRSETGGTQVTLSFPIRKGSNSIVRSNLLTIDYAGGWDHALLELSDVLPAHLFRFKI